MIRAQTDNIGAGGLCVTLDKPLERFSNASVRIEIDPNLPWIECQGKVMWVVPSRNLSSKTEKYDVGIEFTALVPAQQELIRSYIHSRIENS